MQNKIYTIAVISIIFLFISFMSSNIIEKAGADTTKVREENILINPNHYVVEPTKSDSVEIIRSYERTMNRFIDTVQNSLYSMEYDIKKISEKIDSIEKKVTSIDEKIIAIEKKLNIEKNTTSTVLPSTEISN